MSTINNKEDATIALQLLSSFLSTVPTLLTENIDAIIGRLCDVAVNHQHVKSRYTALAALLLVRQKVPAHLILSKQQAVTNSLLPTLDDPKSAVRHQAVITRNAWYTF